MSEKLCRGFDVIHQIQSAMCQSFLAFQQRFVKCLTSFSLTNEINIVSEPTLLRPQLGFFSLDQAEQDHKDSLLFIHLLLKLKCTYRKARRIVLIADNYIIHKSGVTERWLASNPKVRIGVSTGVLSEGECDQAAVECAARHGHPQPEALDHKQADTRRQKILEAYQPFPGISHVLATT